MRVVLLTKTELRHTFFRMYIAQHYGIRVMNSFCESQDGNIQHIIQSKDKEDSIRNIHLKLRDITEEKYFGNYIKSKEDISNPIFIKKGSINENNNVNLIKNLKPDLIIAYGCSIIKSELLNIYKGRFINIHLGLSPYYRGSGTNFWPFVNDELQFVGTTFMHIDKGVDTGHIIHQIPARFFPQDNMHEVGNRLIQDSIDICAKIILNFDEIQKNINFTFPKNIRRYYRKIDFTEQALQSALINIENGIIPKFISSKNRFRIKYPILQNKTLLNQ